MFLHSSKPNVLCTKKLGCGNNFTCLNVSSKQAFLVVVRRTISYMTESSERGAKSSVTLVYETVFCYA